MTDDRYKNMAEDSTFEFVFMGSGIIVDSRLDTTTTTTTTYVTTVLAPAILFKRTNTPQHECDVYVCGGQVYKGQLLVCDFHYNLAAIKILSNSRLQPAIFRSLNDVSSIDVDSYDQSANPFQLRPHTNLFNIQLGTKLIVLPSSFTPSFSVLAHSAIFRSFHKSRYSCKELYWVDCARIVANQTGAVVNFSGEFLGIMLGNFAFLPSNFISRWWLLYTSTGELIRPWVGMEICNLSEARLSFLEKFRNTFSDTGSGVVVTKVEKDTPAYSSGLRVKDVIVRCDLKEVRSKIEFFESMWDNAGKSVTLTVVRVGDGQLLKLDVSIGETKPTEFYRWMLPTAINMAVLSIDDDLFDTTSSDDMSDSVPEVETGVI